MNAINSEFAALPELSKMRLSESDPICIGIEHLLWWAFGRECARLDFSNIDVIGGVPLPAWGTEYVLIEQAKLGCKPDGGGRSEPHPDADLVADAVASLVGGYSLALTVAEFANSHSRPDPMVGVDAKVVPVSWRQSKHGSFAQTEVCGSDEYVSRGRKRVIERRCCPVTFRPSGSEIAAARRNYLLWWSALNELRNTFRRFNNLSCFSVGSAMPAKEPWKNVLTKYSLY